MHKGKKARHCTTSLFEGSCSTASRRRVGMRSVQQFAALGNWRVVCAQQLNGPSNASQPVRRAAFGGHRR
ncbi:hypothetical protein CO2235_90282 [Cupriavidus oxalaticus]|uniref:Uncharacterized protein n=1 Tax=Cupriavidus oxalaticus TaxID=96344 RepID=A0A375GAU4_9BURK|nr:hypothetical protein CO2235_90282 [Cupriavidus oxalaticus]